MTVKSKEDIAKIREGGRILAGIVERLGYLVKPGVSTWEIDIEAEKRIREVGGTPAFKGYRGRPIDPPFPGTICASVNHEVVHGIPRKDGILQNGDLFKLDIGMKYKDRFTDMARTYAVGNISKESRKLLDVTKQCLEESVQVIRDGAKLHDYASAVQKYVESYGFSLVRDLVGHGVGYEVHEPPQIPNYVDAGHTNFTFREGMVIALEPMVNVGAWQVKLADDKWTFVTIDKSLSAHFENTYAVTKERVEQLTAVSSE